jgi:hypothetical protein
VDLDDVSSETEPFSGRFGEAGWGMADPEDRSVDWVWRERVVTLCRVNHTFGVRVLYTTSLVFESMNSVLKTHREESVSSLVIRLSETRDIWWRSVGRELVVVPRGVGMWEDAWWRPSFYTHSPCCLACDNPVRPHCGPTIDKHDDFPWPEAVAVKQSHLLRTHYRPPYL